MTTHAGPVLMPATATNIKIFHGCKLQVTVAAAVLEDMCAAASAAVASAAAHNTGQPPRC
jgi:hypothetical protein